MPESEVIADRRGSGQRRLFRGAAQEELAAVLQMADVFVLPSFFEGLPWW